MTNLDIIKYLANNNPTRLAVFLDDIYCRAWNCGAYAQRNIDEDKYSALEMEFSEEKWLEQEVNTDFFFDNELKEWSKAINKPTIEITYPNNLVIELPFEGKDPNHMWNTDNNFNIIGQAIDEIKLLENITESDKYSSEIYDIFRKEVCAKCSDPNCLRSQVEIYDCYKF